MELSKSAVARALITERIMEGGKLVSDFPFDCPSCGHQNTDGNPCIDDLGLGFAAACPEGLAMTTNGITTACTECEWAGTPKAWRWQQEKDATGKIVREFWRVWR
jgi:hypothetical protein